MNTLTARPIYRCACGRRRPREASECAACGRAAMERLRQQARDMMDLVNRAIRAGLILSYGRNTIPGGRGVNVKTLYEGCPGTWSIDTDGHHWCGLTGEWVTEARAYLEGRA